MNKVNNFLGKIKEDLQEYYTLLLIVVGLPIVALIYVDWRLAFAVFVVVQIVIGLFALRKSE